MLYLKKLAESRALHGKGVRHMGKRVTIKDVAIGAGTSISVVSYVMNNTQGKSISPEMRKRVQEVAKRLNYVPNHHATALRTKKARCIGVISYRKIDNIYAQLMDGIYREAQKDNYRVLIFPEKPEFDNQDYLNYYYDNTVDGLILICPYQAVGSISEETHIQRMIEDKIPFMVIGDRVDLKGNNYICVDYFQTTNMATKYFISKGCTEITYVTPKLELEFADTRLKYEGYCAAMEEAGLEKDICYANKIRENIRRCKTVVTNKSDTARMVTRIAMQEGLEIPRDFLLMAGNTEDFSPYTIPPLSTIAHPGVEMGALAVRAVVEKINGEVVDITDHTIPCTVHIRTSAERDF